MQQFFSSFCPEYFLIYFSIFRPENKNLKSWICPWYIMVLSSITEHSSRPPSRPPAFTLFQLVSVGLAAFLAAGLLSALAFSYCHHLSRPSAESAVIHPSAPNHLAYNKRGNGQAKNEKYIPMEFKVGSLKKIGDCLRASADLLIFLCTPPHRRRRRWTRTTFTTLTRRRATTSRRRWPQPTCSPPPTTHRASSTTSTRTPLAGPTCTAEQEGRLGAGPSSHSLYSDFFKLQDGWRAANSMFAKVKMDHYISCLEPNITFKARELHCEVVTRRPKTSKMQKIIWLSDVTKVCVASMLCFRFILLFVVWPSQDNSNKTCLQQIQEKGKMAVLLQ